MVASGSSPPTYKKKVANFRKQATFQMGNPFFRLTDQRYKFFFKLCLIRRIFRHKNG